MWWNDSLFWLGMLFGFIAGTLYGLLYIAISFSLLIRVTRIRPVAKKHYPPPQKAEPETEELPKNEDYWQQWRKERNSILNADTQPMLPKITDHFN